MLDIRGAIEALPSTGGVVDIPAGTYRITGTLPVRNGLTLRGAGKYATVLICDGFTSPGPRIGGIHIADMSIIGRGAGVGLDLVDVDRSMFERLRIELFPLGIRLKSEAGAYHNWFLQCHVGGGYHLTNANSTRIIGGETRQDNNGTAIRVDCGNNIVIEKVSIEGTTQTGIDAPGLDSDSQRVNVLITGCRFELNVTPSVAMRIGPHAYDCRAYGNFFTSNVTPLVDMGTRTVTDI